MTDAGADQPYQQIATDGESWLAGISLRSSIIDGCGQQMSERNGYRHLGIVAQRRRVRAVQQGSPAGLTGRQPPAVGLEAAQRTGSCRGSCELSGRRRHTHRHGIVASCRANGATQRRPANESRMQPECPTRSRRRSLDGTARVPWDDDDGGDGGGRRRLTGAHASHPIRGQAADEQAPCACSPVAQATTKKQ
jgi:hypothetical protein